ncbi:hypothetical protein D9M72_447600 [compost metagenome]
MQKLLDALDEAFPFDGDLAGKQRFRQDIEGQFGHVAGDIGGERCYFRLRVALDERFRPAQHLPGKSLGVARGEHWRYRLARPLPDLAFGGQQTVAQDRAQDQPPDLRHLIIADVFDEDIADQAGIVDDQGALRDEPGLDPRQRVGRFAPEFERIAQDGPDDLQVGRHADPRNGSRGLEGLRTHVHGDCLSRLRQDFRFLRRNQGKCFTAVTTGLRAPRACR